MGRSRPGLLSSLRRLAGLGLAAAALGCGVGEDAPPGPGGTLVLRFIEDDPRELLDLDSLLRGEETIEGWGFDGAAERAAWSVLDEPDLEPGENGIPLPASRKSLLLERAVALDAAEVDLVRLVVRYEGRDLPRLRAWKATLEWAGGDPRATAASGVPDPGPEDIELPAAPATPSPSPRGFGFRFSLAGHPAWRGRIDRLRFTVRWPSGFYRGGATVERAYAASGVLDRPRLRELAETGCKVEVGRTARNSLPALAGLPIERRLEIPPGSRLRFAYGVPESVAGGVRFRVLAAQGAEEPETLFEARVGDRETGRWHRGVVDLSPFAGRPITLRLEAESERPERPIGGFPLWGSPEVVTLAGGGGRARDAATDPPRFNLVLVSLDTLRADHLGLYGYRRPTSPHLDRLAAESVVFDLAIAQAPATFYSHRSLFQSRLASQLEEETPLLAEILHAAGYRTAAFTAAGKISSKLGFAAGFDLYYENRRGFSESFEPLEEWLRRSAREPFFLFVHTYDVHIPYDPPPPLDTLFFADYRGPVRGPLTTEIVRAIKAREDRGRAPAGVRPRNPEIEEMLPLSAADRRQLVSLYDGGVRFVDQYIGELTALLAELDLADDTVLAVISDHGEEFWDHGSVSHSHSLYQELVRVPLVLRLPAARRAGTRVSQPVRLMDLAPTLLAFAGIPPPSGFQGRSLLPLVAGERPAKLPAVSENGSHAKALLHGPWKLIVDRGSGREMLFDLRSDPGEEHDLAAERPDLVARLSAELDRLLAGGQGTVDHDPEEVVDEELRDQLKALGYID